MLVDYSDSESEPEHTKHSTPPPPLQPPRSGLSALLPKPKAAGKKDSDGSKGNGPKKIIINLPKLENNDLGDGPPKKKAKIGGGPGLSAMLPAPQRSGTGLKNVPVQKAKDPSSRTAEQAGELEKDSLEKNISVSVASSTIFVPQSVARKPIQPASAFRKQGGVGSAGGITRPAPTKPKVSLFGSGPSLSAIKPTTKTTLTGEYQPIMLTTVKPANKPNEMPSTHEDNAYFEGGDTNEGNVVAFGMASSTITHNGSQNLETIAREAGLSDAAMRQLYGRRGHGNIPINITNYSVDDEYKSNEISRSLGLLEEAKPVRAIAPGKHQLSSLLNAAQSQKGALEDAFAQGKRNKKEAGSKYGW